MPPTRGGYRGRGEDTPLPQGFDPLTTQKVPPVVLFQNPNFWLADPKIFLMALFDQNLSKVSKNAFFSCFFFQKLYLGGVAVLGGSPPESNAGVSDDVGEELTLARDRHF